MVKVQFSRESRSIQYSAKWIDKQKKLKHPT